MRKETQDKLKRLGLVEAHQTVFVSSVVNKVIGTIYFILFFFMKRLIHANKTLKSTYTLKTQGYLYILCLLMLFLKI